MQSAKRNLGERVVRIPLVKIIAAIFAFCESGRLGRERNSHLRDGQQSKGRGEEVEEGGAVTIITR